MYDFVTRIVLKKRIRADIEDCLAKLDTQIEEVHRLADELNCRPSQVRTTNGEFMLSHLVAARAQLLAAMVSIL